MQLRGASLNHLSQKTEKLSNHLRNLSPRSFTVTVMPDFFLDRLVSWNSTLKEFSTRISKVASQKGGSIDNVTQMDLMGGNAINTASALATLGAEVSPIVCTNKLGLRLLKLHLQRLGINLSHVKISDQASITTALEFTQDRDNRNVMLRDLGSLTKLHPKDLSEKDFALFEDADYVCIFNWAGTQAHGTEIAKKVFSFVKAEGTGKTYYDTADPLPNRQKIPELIGEVLRSRNLIDILSLNENEAMTYTKYLAPEQLKELRKSHKPTPILAKECAEILSHHLSSRLDLHTTNFSATFKKDKSTVAPAFETKALRATGAGDAWNAGNIFADANHFPDDLRLIFSNAVAAYYLSSPLGKHPTLKQLYRFLQVAICES